jgi:N-acetylglucosaminyl-diphospho-decaprenol L-rhamnosyltransferase
VDPADTALQRASGPGPQLSIVIVSYNTSEWLDRCLESVTRETPDTSYEIIVVDNASQDGSPELLRERWPDVRLLAMDDNLGFARGVNLGATHASGQYLLLLNPDTIVHDHALERLVAFAEAHPHHGLYGGRNLTVDGDLEPASCWGAPSLWSLLCFGLGLSTAFKHVPLFNPEAMPGWQRDSVRTVGIISGSLLLVRRDLWERLGGFDERFFMYGEDADLCMRAAALGFSPVITPEATITHAIGQSSKLRRDKLLLLFRGKATLIRKHWSPPRRWLGLRLLTLGVGLRALLSRGLAALGRDPGDAVAWRDGWAHRREWLPGY